CRERRASRRVARPRGDSTRRVTAIQESPPTEIVYARDCDKRHCRSRCLPCQSAYRRHRAAGCQPSRFLLVPANNFPPAFEDRSCPHLQESPARSRRTPLSPTSSDGDRSVESYGTAHKHFFLRAG